MEKLLQNLIERVMLKKYDYLINVNVGDLFDDVDENRKNVHYIAEFETSRCLESEEMMKIDTEVKDLFKMVKNVEQDEFFTTRKPNIKCYFDCDDGEGFVMNYYANYSH
jgi:hypothetical protein